jgi:hypothetical protein
MNKPFLLIAGDVYYPSADTDDWVACYSTYQEAKEQVEEVHRHEYFTKGKHKGEIKSTHMSYIIKNLGERDWYHIVDLCDWTER